jgi:hypothetical protein
MIDEVTKARLAIGLPSNRFYDAGDNVKCPISRVKRTFRNARNFRSRSGKK